MAHVSVTVGRPGALEYAGAEYDTNDGAGQLRDWESGLLLYISPACAAQWAQVLAAFAESHGAVTR